MLEDVATYLDSKNSSVTDSHQAWILTENPFDSGFANLSNTGRNTYTRYDGVSWKSGTCIVKVHDTTSYRCRQNWRSDPALGRKKEIDELSVFCVSASSLCVTHIHKRTAFLFRSISPDPLWIVIIFVHNDIISTTSWHVNLNIYNARRRLPRVHDTTSRRNTTS